MDGNWKLTPTHPGNRPWATTAPGFLWKEENMKLILIPRFTAFMSFLIQKQWDCHLHCLFYYVLGLQYMPEKAPTTADFSFSLPPTTLEIVSDKIPHPPESVNWNPPPLRKKTWLPSMGGARIFAGTALSECDSRHPFRVVWPLCTQHIFTLIRPEAVIHQLLVNVTCRLRPIWFTFLIRVTLKQEEPEMCLRKSMEIQASLIMVI